MTTGKYFLEPVIPDVTNYEVLVKAPSEEENYWAGAPAVFTDREGTIWLTYRVRNPEERGKEIRIARSQDGLEFETVKIIKKEELNAKSVERSSLLQDPKTGDYKLYLSPDPDYSAADPQALGWHIVKLEDVNKPADFNPSTAKVIVSPEGTESETGPVKDPYVINVGWKYYMFYTGKDGGGEQAHLAISVDGENWCKARKINPILGREGWHDFHTRVACVLPREQGFIIYYEGTNRRWYQPMYNLQTGIATSLDFQRFFDVTPEEPVLSSPTPSSSSPYEGYETLRYLDYALIENKILFYYEVANENGAFELRVTQEPLT